MTLVLGNTALVICIAVLVLALDERTDDEYIVAVDAAPRRRPPRRRDEVPARMKCG